MPYQSVFRPDLFKGQTIMVTGGGSGIGRCTAHELAALGANVVILGRTAEKLAEVKAEIEEDGGRVDSLVCDIREEAMVIAAIDAVLVAHGRIDGLVNNAGGQYRAAMKTISTKGFEAVVRSNLTGGFIFMREVYNRWMEANGGAIVNIIADIWHGWPEFSHSAAARGGMLTLSETAACEWSASGVRVNTVAPGGIVSSGFDTTRPRCRRNCTISLPACRCNDSAPRRKSLRPLCFCYRLPPPISRAHAFGSTAARPTPAIPGSYSRTAGAHHLKAFIVRSSRKR